MTIFRQMGRLAFREEGSNWNVYYALPDTMEGAIWIGSIAMRFIAGPEHARRKKDFMRLMRACVDELVKEVTGAQLQWPEPEGHKAPESERGGNA